MGHVHVEPRQVGELREGVPPTRGPPEEARQLAEHVLDPQPLLHVVAPERPGPPFAVKVPGLEAQPVRKVVVAGAGVGGRAPLAPLRTGHRPRLAAQPAVVVREELPLQVVPRLREKVIPQEEQCAVTL